MLPSVESEVGALDAGKVAAVFKTASGSLQECYASGVSRVAFMSGDIKLAVRVAEDGSAKYAFVKESSLGDRQTEECMLGVLRKQTWPKPVGGKEGNAETTFGFDPGTRTGRPSSGRRRAWATRTSRPSPPSRNAAPTLGPAR